MPEESAMPLRMSRRVKAITVDLGKTRLDSLTLYEPGALMESLPVACLEEHCYEETLRYYRSEANDGRFGYQLFRRAIVERDEAAWQAVERIYRGQLERWARCHRLYQQAGEEAEALANRALENLWRRVDPDTFNSFPNLNSLLGYLQRCVYNLVIDQARMRAREQQRTQALGQALAGQVVPSPQGRALDHVRAGELWETVRAQCRNEREECVAYCYLVLALKPSDILALHGELFPSTATVNAILATLLKRLRRSPTLRRQCAETLVG
jgi:DNA-directed RNA polymerase specialized sigma24 family protein